jgi:hypothetical protein
MNKFMRRGPLGGNDLKAISRELANGCPEGSNP